MNYYEQQEQIDNECLTKFNDNMKWFTSMERQDHFNRIDWLCTDKKGRNCSVELKTRFMDIFKFDTIFIEVEKYEHLMEKYQNEGYIPLYINFFQDSNHVAVWDLRKINKETTEVIQKLILDPGDQQTKLVKRMLLHTMDADYYEFENNKYIKRW